MTLSDRFIAAVIEACDEAADAFELLPTLLAQACVRVLVVDGAGLSLTEELRVPLGASDEVVTRAERLQTTLGEGPCLQATATAEAIVVDLATMEARWPMFHREVIAKTPFRSIASIPLRSPHGSRYLGALDLYSTRTEAPVSLSITEVATDIAGPIAAILFAPPTADNAQGGTLSTWLNNEAVTDRMNVWVAIGMFIEHSRMSNQDALAALRAYAFSHDTTLDDVADQITSRRLNSSALLS